MYWHQFTQLFKFNGRVKYNNILLSISLNAGDIFTIFTENVYRYNYTWMYPVNKYLTFKVQSCNDGHILLSNSIGETGSSSYEIVIGGFDNTWSEIRRGSQGPALVSVETPSIMYCQELLPFWVRWENKSVVVGSGPLDSHVIMRYDDPNMTDIWVASTTSWTTAASEYQFLQTEGGARCLLRW